MNEWVFLFEKIDLNEKSRDENLLKTPKSHLLIQEFHWRENLELNVAPSWREFAKMCRHPIDTETAANTYKYLDKILKQIEIQNVMKQATSKSDWYVQ